MKRVPHETDVWNSGMEPGCEMGMNTCMKNNAIKERMKHDGLNNFGGGGENSLQHYCKVELAK